MSEFFEEQLAWTEAGQLVASDPASGSPTRQVLYRFPPDHDRHPRAYRALRSPADHVLILWDDGDYSEITDATSKTSLFIHPFIFDITLINRGSTLAIATPKGIQRIDLARHAALAPLAQDRDFTELRTGDGWFAAMGDDVEIWSDDPEPHRSAVLQERVSPGEGAAAKDMIAVFRSLASPPVIKLYTVSLGQTPGVSLARPVDCIDAESIDLSSDARWLVATCQVSMSSMQRKLVLWDRTSGWEPLRLDLSSLGEPLSAGFSRGGKLRVSTAERAVIIDMTPGSWMQQLCNLAGPVPELRSQCPP